MQQANDYMDDLFKKAADHYPLNTKSSNWEHFNKKLSEQSELHPEKSPRQKFYNQSGRWMAAAAFVLIPLVIAVVKPYQQGQRSNEHDIVNVTPLALSQNTIETSGKIGSAHLPEDYAGNVLHKSTEAKASTNLFNSVGIKLEMPGNSDMQHNFPASNTTEKNQGLIINSELNELGENKSLVTDKTKPGLVLKQEQPNPGAAKKSRFYLGAVVAPEYTRVKLQQFSKPGINFGVIMGFQVNKNLSIELGVLLAKKYYYSDGKYLPKNNLRRDGSDIINLQASNSITEMPFVVKYNFSQQKKNNFFASAGAVSYAMHKELYNYSYDANGQEKKGVKYVNKAANYYFSNIQLSAGYERQVAKNCILRIEPYYRIPVSGIGISDLPVTSIGLNIALTTRLR